MHCIYTLITGVYIVSNNFYNQFCFKFYLLDNNFHLVQPFEQITYKYKLTIGLPLLKVKLTINYCYSISVKTYNNVIKLYYLYFT